MNRSSPDSNHDSSNDAERDTGGDTEVGAMALGGVERTMLAPLAIRAAETGLPNRLFADEAAVRIVQSLGKGKLEQALPGVKSNRLFWLSIALRTRLIDEVVRGFVATRDRPRVVCLGAGLDSRFTRIDDGRVAWLDVDVPDSIAVRRRFYEDSDRQRSFAGSAFDRDWIDALPPGDPRDTLVLAEGLLMYFDEPVVRGLFTMVADELPGSAVLYESISPRLVGPVRSAGTGLDRLDAVWRWGARSGAEVAAWDARLRHEADLAYIDRFPRRWGLYRLGAYLPFVRKDLRQTFKVSLASTAPPNAGDAGWEPLGTAGPGTWEWRDPRGDTRQAERADG